MHFTEQSARPGVARFFERAYLGKVDNPERIAEILVESELVAAEAAVHWRHVHDIETAPRHGNRDSDWIDSSKKLSRANPDVIVRDLGELHRGQANALSK